MGRITEAAYGISNNNAEYISGAFNISAVKGVVINGSVQGNLSSSNNQIGVWLSASTSMFAPLSAAVDFVMYNNSTAPAEAPQTPIALK